MSLDPIRHRLQLLAADYERSLAWLSDLIGRKEMCLPRYVDEGLPAILPPFDRDLAGSADLA